MSNFKFPEYTTSYISGVMSLRKPQIRSLEILDDILRSIQNQNIKNIDDISTMITDKYQIFREFEHDFINLAFSLSMGVGKTRLMGAFITYLYTNYGIRNFFVVAPNLTIYNKLKSDLSDPNNEKYVFKGIGCFNFPPNVISGENLDTKTLTSLGFGDINIFVFNNAKFNRDTTSIKDFSEFLGTSYFDYLSSISDLVVIMDESHHYRNNATGKAISELKPYLAIELTGTPQVQEGATSKFFKNVVYDYPMGRAIKDGFTKIPYAMTRRDIETYNFSEDEMDLMMLTDGVQHHEILRNYFITYSSNNEKKLIKPFVLVVCKNTNHADDIEKIIKSDDFFAGYYKDKVIVIHSNQDKNYKDENIERLLRVEKNDESTEIVIHVDILKEGWDVNNLYTIIPLRTATSKTLRMQTVGRGLRLPYGEQTGDRLLDSLTITAHDKFQEIINEASDPNSIFRTQNIIYHEDEEPTFSFTSLSLFEEVQNLSVPDFYEHFPTLSKSTEVDDKINNIQKLIVNELSSGSLDKSELTKDVVSDSVLKKVKVDVDLSQIAEIHQDVFKDWIIKETEKTIKNIAFNSIYIPVIEVKSDGSVETQYRDCDLDTSKFNYGKISNDMLIKSLVDPKDIEVINSNGLDFLATNPHKVIINEIRDFPEIDYENASDLINKLVKQLLDYFNELFPINDVNHIVMFNKKDIARKIYDQIVKHAIFSQPSLIEEISGVTCNIITPKYNVSESIPRNFYNPIDESNIKKYIFEGFSKSLHKYYKFDSDPERIFAIICESDKQVIKWLRPAPHQFKLVYKNGKRYQPDFVIETTDFYYLVEIKGENLLMDEDVVLKRERAVKYCELASIYCKSNGFKEWRHLFIPAKQVKVNTSIQFLISQYVKQ